MLPCYVFRLPSTPRPYVWLVKTASIRTSLPAACVGAAVNADEFFYHNVHIVSPEGISCVLDKVFVCGGQRYWK